jgi:hypothetical protein
VQRPSFDGCRQRVDELLDAHVDIGVVEVTIDAFALSREEKDALWLWASGQRDRLISSGGGRPRSAISAAADAHD